MPVPVSAATQTDNSTVGPAVTAAALGAGWWADRAGLVGTVAVVIGGAGGLGLAVTDDLLANGVHVAALDRHGPAVQSLRRAHPDVLVVEGDAREPEVLEDLYAAVDARWGRLDTVVHCVGGTFRAPFVDTRSKGWDTLWRTNFGYVLESCSLAVPRMQATGRGGSIINLTTIEADRAAPGVAVYSAAKAGLAHFSRSLAVELGADGIRVNNVAPDLTPVRPGGEEPEVGARGTVGGMDVGFEPELVRIAIPMKRVGQPTDISGAVVFLASNLSRYITGTTLRPDGGTWASSGWFDWPGHGYLPVVPAGAIDPQLLGTQPSQP